jgi:cadmium resistance protein CadD (predicted permease)
MVHFLVTTIIAFVSTALDDFVVQLYFMSKASIIVEEEERHQAYRQIVAGTILSNLTVIGLALFGLIFELVVSTQVISLLGLFPLCTGLWAVYEGIREMDLDTPKLWSLLDPMAVSRHNSEGDVELLRSHHGSAEKGADQDEEIGEGVQENPLTQKQEFDQLPQGEEDEDEFCADGRTTTDASRDSGDNSDDFEKEGNEGKGELDEETGGDRSHRSSGEGDDDDSSSEGSCPVDEDELDNWFSNTARRMCGSILSPLALEVLVMNLAVSSDNIVIYTAVFVTESIYTVFLTVVLMLFLVLVTLALAMLTSKMEAVSTVMEKYSGYLIPPLLISLGCYILSDSIIFHH